MERDHLGAVFGIESTDFAAETAKLALFIAEAEANAGPAGAVGAEPAKLQLQARAKIVGGSALRLDWEAVCPPSAAGAVATDLAGSAGRLALNGSLEVVIAGSPPFSGGHQRSSEIKADVRSHGRDWRILSQRTP